MPITDEAKLLITCKADGTKEVNKFANAVDDASSKTTELVRSLAGLFSTAMIANFTKKAIDTFSTLEETTAKFYQVFSGVENAADKAANTLIDRFGASEISARSMLSQTGDLLVGFGFAREEALKLSESVAQLGSDIASFSNYAGGAEGAAYAITKAMLGETEQAKMLGIAIKTDSEEYKQLYKQIKETQGVTDTQAKALTALKIAFQQKGDAMGDFERTMSSIANQGRILENQLVQLEANIGRGLSDAFRTGQGGVISLLRGFNTLEESTQDFVTVTGTAAVAVGTLNMGLALLRRKGITAAAAMKTLTGSILPLLAVSAVFAGLTVAYSKNEREMKKLISTSEMLADSAKKTRIEAEKSAKEDQEKVKRINELAVANNRTKDQQKELSDLASQLNAKYKDLNLTTKQLGETAGLTAEQWERMIEQQGREIELKALNEIVKQTSLFDKTIESFANMNRIQSWGWGEQKKVFEQIQELYASGADAGKYEWLAAGLSDTDLKQRVMQVAALRKEIEAAEKRLARLQSGEEDPEMVKKRREENEKMLKLKESLAKQREKIVWLGNLEIQGDDEKVKMLGEKIASLEKEYGESLYKERTEERLKKEHELWKEIYNYRKQQTEVWRNKEIESAKLIAEENKKKLEEQLEQLKAAEQARTELVSRLQEPSQQYRTTVQSALDGAESIRLQNRTFLSGGDYGDLQKKSFDNSVEQKKIVANIEKIMQTLKTDIAYIQSRTAGITVGPAN